MNHDLSILGEDRKLFLFFLLSPSNIAKSYVRGDEIMEIGLIRVTSREINVRIFLCHVLGKEEKYERIILEFRTIRTF